MIQSVRSERICDHPSGNLGQDLRIHAHEQRGTNVPDLMRPGGNSVDGAQPKAPLLFSLDTQEELPTMDGRRRPLRIQGPPPQIRSFIAA